jgi:putative acetyltransferase
MIIRAYRPDDADALAQIFYDAVRIGAASHYTSAQLAAWAPDRPPAEAWAARLAPLTSFVAVNPAPLGFMSLRSDGYLDLAFVAPDQRGKGVAQALYAAVLAHAQSLHLPRLATAASHLARPFFRRLGWQETAAQVVERHGQQIENFRVQIILAD